MQPDNLLKFPPPNSPGSKLPFAVATSGYCQALGYLWLFGGFLPDIDNSIKTLRSLNGFEWSEVGVNSCPVFWNNVAWFNNAFYLLDNFQYKLYRSTDGQNWTNITPTSPALPHLVPLAFLVYGSKLCIVYYQHTLKSSNGTIWQSAANNFPIDISINSSVVFNGKIWIMGGQSNSAPDYDISPKVFFSSDGLTWQEAGSNVLPANSMNQSAIIFQNRLYLVGGSDVDYIASSAVIYSEDGELWTPVASLPDRIGSPSVFILNNQLFVVGGWGDINPVDSIFYTDNGKYWPLPGNSLLKGFPTVSAP